MKSSFEKYFEGQMALGGCGLWIIGILVVLCLIYSWIVDIIDGDFKTIFVTAAVVIGTLPVFISFLPTGKAEKKTSIPTTEWKNKSATTTPACPSGSWRQYWIEKSNKEWPESCSVEGCCHRAVFGSVICNPKTDADYVVPVCPWCRIERSEFSIKEEGVCVRVEEK